MDILAQGLSSVVTRNRNANTRSMNGISLMRVGIGLFLELLEQQMAVAWLRDRRWTLSMLHSAPVRLATATLGQFHLAVNCAFCTRS